MIRIISCKHTVVSVILCFKFSPALLRTLEYIVHRSESHTLLLFCSSAAMAWPTKAIRSKMPSGTEAIDLTQNWPSSNSGTGEDEDPVEVSDAEDSPRSLPSTQEFSEAQKPEVHSAAASSSSNSTKSKYKSTAWWWLPILHFISYVMGKKSRSQVREFRTSSMCTGLFPDSFVYEVPELVFA